MLQINAIDIGQCVKEPGILVPISVEAKPDCLRKPLFSCGSPDFLVALGNLADLGVEPVPVDLVTFDVAMRVSQDCCMWMS